MTKKIAFVASPGADAQQARVGVVRDRSVQAEAFVIGAEHLAALEITRGARLTDGGAAGYESTRDERGRRTAQVDG